MDSAPWTFQLPAGGRWWCLPIERLQRNSSDRRLLAGLWIIDGGNDRLYWREVNLGVSSLRYDYSPLPRRRLFSNGGGRTSEERPGSRSVFWSAMSVLLAYCGVFGIRVNRTDICSAQYFNMSWLLHSNYGTSISCMCHNYQFLKCHAFLCFLFATPLVLTRSLCLLLAHRVALSGSW